MNDVELLKQSRKVLEMTQSQLANRLGVNPVTVRRWESGQRSPGLEIFRRVLEMVVTGISNDIGRQQHVLNVATKLTKKK
jgi:transcriptional regulator with XRE-family HTH domain